MAERPLPVPDDVSERFWAAARDGKLVIQRCGECETYAHPPREYCLACGSESVRFEEVSGRGTIYSYTETMSGARHPFFASAVPYLVGLVELEEQQGLLLLSNLPGARLDELSIGMPVEVVFETVAPDVALPQFRLARSRPDTTGAVR